QVRCAMFRMHRRQRSFTPENGDYVIVKAQVGLYEARGDYQLIVEDIEEAGAGALLRAFEALKNKLDAEGLFDPSRKKPLPHAPKTIGIITSPTGAAVRDILIVLKKRFPIAPVIIYPVSVQGEQAKSEIASAVETANVRNECDLLILARGGGSLEDLWAFNEERVARAIHASRIPIVTGIGHEIDFTIADFVADLRAPTPSSAAEHATPDSREWNRSFQALEHRLNRVIAHGLSERRSGLERWSRRLHQQEPVRRVQNMSQRLDELDLRLRRNVRVKLQRCRESAGNLSGRLTRCGPTRKIEYLDIRRRFLDDRLSSAIGRRIETLTGKLANAGQTLHAVSPLATLKRGYAIVSRQDSGEIVRSANQVNIGDRIRAQFAKGRIVGQIEEIIDD
ncbi:MAG: exodeoxyribonuclease VII large subunit, partial [Gammaproteobacteria bacterium]